MAAQGPAAEPAGQLVVINTVPREDDNVRRGHG